MSVHITDLSKLISIYCVHDEVCEIGCFHPDPPVIGNDLDPISPLGLIQAEVCILLSY